MVLNKLRGNVIMSDKQKLCFVVMGFGRKTDYETMRTLDLDATYDAIIEPAVEANGYRCVRAKDVLHSGVIDVKMYDMLLRADLVIADISTGNVNAVYELGVRHALRPKSTIIMKESEGKFHFDLDHTSTFEYQHMGDDIGVREAKRAVGALEKLISEVTEASETDSPVYTYIPALRQPMLSDEEFAQVVDEVEETQETLSALLTEAEQAAKMSDHKLAARKFSSALELSEGNSYLRQQTALHTYKSKDPSEPLALMKAQGILAPLDPEKSNDPETLGLSGAIYKRLWHHNQDRVTLDLAIHFYHKGFELRADYYNGENAALCFDLRSELQEDDTEKLFDQMSARKIREAVAVQLSEIVADESFDDRPDAKWVCATLANCLFATHRLEEAALYEAKFLKLEPAAWEFETYESSKRELNRIHKFQVVED